MGHAREAAWQTERIRGGLAVPPFFTHNCHLRAIVSMAELMCRIIESRRRLASPYKGLQRSLPDMGRRADLHRSATFSLAVLICVAWIAPIVAGEPVFAAEQWLEQGPAESGLDPKLLEQGRDYALTGGGSGVIIHRGRAVLKWGDQRKRYDLEQRRRHAPGCTAGCFRCPTSAASYRCLWPGG